MFKVRSINLILATSAALILTACGGGSSSGSTAPTASVEGQFIDDVVQGLNYSCSSGAKGLTDNNGHYTCKEGDDVVFSLGENILLGTLPAQSAFYTPYSVFPGDLEASLNLVALIQALDKDGDLHNGLINIDLSLLDRLPADIDFHSLTFREDIEKALGIALPSAHDAQKKLNENIVAAGGVVPDWASDLVPVPSPSLEPTPEPSPTPTPPGPTPTPTPDTTAPVFTSNANVQVLENKTSALTLVATDESTVTYGINGGDDANSFNVDSTTGDVTFKVAPDYESCKTNYEFTASATDTSGNEATQDVNITILNCECDTPVTHNGTEYCLVVSPKTCKVWFDRNLGAARVCTSITDTACFGDYYQWGRNADGHENSTSDTNDTLATQFNPVQNEILGKYITNTDSSSYEWAAIDSEGSQRSANWSVTDGTNLCPVGFRVPSFSELYSEVQNTIHSSDEAFDSFLKIPGAGMRLADDGQIDTYNDFSAFWTSTPYINSDPGGSSSPASMAIQFESSSIHIYEHLGRAFGLTVRCIQDDSAH
ncbi:cadherin domain-containing protein [Sulfurovum sp.]|uniref:cadherin domain-containing protein n=1 Tax=Sulfurovum sp. TaxID=1969726 RepID=UPI0025CE2CD6|nr:cadherin domain-containing protein [Sulfurovum sp.]